MDEYIKILLGSEDVVIRNNEDSFLNLELSRTSSEIKPSNIDNDFNLSDQYVKERNASLKFCVYGTIESKYNDCNDIIINIRTSDNDILFNPKISKNQFASRHQLIRTIPLSKNGTLSKNIYDKNKASYFFMFELQESQLNAKIEAIRNSGQIPVTDKIILTIDDPSHLFYDIIEIPFIFYDENGDFIQYGTKTTDIDVDGNTTVIDNDFPFFYDRHWIKHNIIPSKRAFVSFIPSEGVTVIPENITGGTFSGQVALDFPSKFGRESVTVVLDTDETIRNPGQDFTFVPQTISWNVGERIKNFNVGIIDDLFVEQTERATFRLDNIVNANLLPHTNGKFILEIADNDIASQANFRRSSLTVSESAQTLSIEVILDRPVTVPGQSIDIVIDNSTGNTAVLGEDFILDNVGNRTGVNSKTIFFKQGDTGATHTIEIIEDLKYELDKTLTLKLANPTQNIEVGGQTPNIKIIITDSMITNTTRYIIPGNFEAGVGAFRVNKQTLQEQYKWALINDDAAFTNSFQFSLNIFNVGVPVIFNNTIINVNELIFSKKFTGATETLTLDLPANDILDQNSKSFKNTKYQFIFNNIEGPNEDNSIGPNFIFNNNQNRYDDVNVVFEVKPASGTGQYNFYLISEVSKIASNYNSSNNTCNTFISSNELTDIKINGIAFLPHSMLPDSTLFGQPVAKTKIQSFFKNKPIQNHCSFSGSLLPFGFGPAADAPYAERLIELSFRDMFSQVGNVNNAVNSQLNLIFKSNSIVPGFQSGFFNWADTSQRMKTEMEMHIVNLGTKNIRLFGKDAGEGDTIILKQSDISSDFNNLHLKLEGNTSYVLSANSFNEASYSISFKNVNFYDKDDTFIKGPVQFPIAPFTLQASANTVGVPVYVLVSQYDEITLGSNGFGQNLCSGTVFDTSRDIKVRGMLFPNSKTDFVGASFVKGNDDIIPTCQNSPFQQKIL